MGLAGEERVVRGTAGTLSFHVARRNWPTAPVHLARGREHAILRRRTGAGQVSDGANLLYLRLYATC